MAEAHARAEVHVVWLPSSTACSADSGGPVADKEDDASEVDRRIGRRLRELGLAQKLTQGELARGRYTAAYISSVERGKAPPTLKLLRWCAARLDRSLGDLVGEPERDPLPGPPAGEEHAQAAFAELQAALLVAEGDVAAALIDAAPVDPDFSVYVLRALADALLRDGVAREAHRVFGEALDAYERFADPQLRADDAIHRAQAAPGAGQYVNAYMLLSWAWGTRREAAVQRAAARMLLYHRLLGFRAAPADDRERELRQALALAEIVGDEEVRSLVASFLAVILARQGRSAEAAPPVTREHADVGAPAAAPSPRRRAAAALAEGWLAQVGGMVAEARSFAHEAAAALAEVAAPQPDLAFDFAMLAELSDAVDEHSLGLQALKKANELLG